MDIPSRTGLYKYTGSPAITGSYWEVTDCDPVSALSMLLILQCWQVIRNWQTPSSRDIEWKTHNTDVRETSL